MKDRKVKNTIIINIIYMISMKMESNEHCKLLYIQSILKKHVNYSIKIVIMQAMYTNNNNKISKHFIYRDGL